MRTPMANEQGGCDGKSENICAVLAVPDEPTRERGHRTKLSGKARCSPADV